MKYPGKQGKHPMISLKYSELYMYISNNDVSWLRSLVTIRRVKTTATKYKVLNVLSLLHDRNQIYSSVDDDQMTCTVYIL